MAESIRPGRWSAAVALLAVTVVFAAAFGLFVPNAYPGVTELQRQTWRAQDAVNLVAAVLLVSSSRRAAAGSWVAHQVQLGLLAWLAYCYLHLAFGAAFTPVFLLYTAAAGLSAACFLDGFVRIDVESQPPVTGFPGRPAAVFFSVAGLGIAGLWLSEVVPGVLGIAPPPNIHLGGLPNPTWVLDLGWLIPWALLAAWQLVRGHVAAQLNTVVLLVLLTVLSVAMLASTPFGLAAGLGQDPVAAPQLVAFTIVFGILGAIEAVLLVRALRGQYGSGFSFRTSWWGRPVATSDRAEAGLSRDR